MALAARQRHRRGRAAARRLRPRPSVPVAPARPRHRQYGGAGARRHAATRVCRQRRRVALPDHGEAGLAALSQGIAHLRGPLVLPPSRRESLRAAARSRRRPAPWPHRLGRFDADHAGGADHRTDPAQLPRQAGADPARAAAGSAPEQGADPRPVPQPRAIRRSDRRCRGSLVGVPGQAGQPAVARRGGAARGTAAIAEPAAAGPPPRGGAHRARQGAAPHARPRRVERGGGARRGDRTGGGAFAARAVVRGLAGRTPAPAATAGAAHRQHHRREPAARGRGPGQRVSRALAGTHVGGAAGGRQRDAGGAHLRRHQRLRRSAAAWLHRHGERAALARLDAEAVPVRPGTGRRPDPLAEPAGRRAAGFRRLPAGQFR